MGTKIIQEIAVKKEQSRQSRTSGLLSLEASIALVLFIFLMLYMYSYLVIFEVRNEIAHVLLTTADSLALDAFANESLGDDESLKGILYGIYGSNTAGNGTYTNSQKWYKSTGEDGSVGVASDEIKTRFIAYMSGGDSGAANQKLESLNVIGGINGLDFSGSSISDGDVNLEVRYKVKYEFRILGFGKEYLEFSQSCSSKLWNGK